MRGRLTSAPVNRRRSRAGLTTTTSSNSSSNSVGRRRPFFGSAAATTFLLLLLTFTLLPRVAHGRIYLSGAGADSAIDIYNGINNGTSFESMPALFGRIMDDNKLYEGRLQFLRENPYLCDPVTNISSSSFVLPKGPVIPDSHGDNISLVQPVILLASRGVCPFLKKAQVAQDIDPAVQYLIIFNFNAGGGGLDSAGGAGGGEDTFVPMFAEYGDSRLVLLSVTHRTGQALKQYLASQPAEVLEAGGPVIAFDDDPPAGLLSVDDLRDMLLSALGLFFMLISFSGCILMVAGTYGVLQPNGAGGIRIHLVNAGVPDDNPIGVYVSNRSGVLTPQQVQRLVERSRSTASSSASSSTATLGNNEDSSNCCAVCLDEFGPDSDVLTLPECRHSFHTECITPWLTERQAKCPLCKHDVLEYVLRMDSTAKIEASTEEDGSGQQGAAAGVEANAGAAPRRSIWNLLRQRRRWSLVAPVDPSAAAGDRRGAAAIGPEEMALEVDDVDDMNNQDMNQQRRHRRGASSPSSSSLEMAPHPAGRRGSRRPLQSSSS